jgi:beta-glucosidase
MPTGTLISEKPRSPSKYGHGIGQVGPPSDADKGKNARDAAVLTNAIQKFFIENTRLGIPVFFHEECLHGQAAVDATSFPQLERQPEGKPKLAFVARRRNLAITVQ